MKLDEILSKAGRHKARKRIGRGTGSGMGKTSGRGHKGYSSRAGARQRLGYEGGAIGTLARIPQRGFNNANFRKEYQIVNVASLAIFDDGATVDGLALEQARLIDDAAKPIKVLGNGEITKKLTVVATKFSASAAKKIADAGGTVEAVERVTIATEPPQAEIQEPVAEVEAPQAEAEEPAAEVQAPQAEAEEPAAEVQALQAEAEEPAAEVEAPQAEAEEPAAEAEAPEAEAEEEAVEAEAPEAEVEAETPEAEAPPTETEDPADETDEQAS